MVQDIALQTAEPADLQLGWSRGLSLTARILAVNLFVLALLGAGLFFLDSYRVRLIAEREDTARLQAAFLAESLSLVAPDKRAAYIYEFGQEHESRIRVYAQNGLYAGNQQALRKRFGDIIVGTHGKAKCFIQLFIFRC